MSHCLSVFVCLTVKLIINNFNVAVPDAGVVAVLRVVVPVLHLDGALCADTGGGRGRGLISRGGNGAVTGGGIGAVTAGRSREVQGGGSGAISGGESAAVTGGESGAVTG